MTFTPPARNRTGAALALALLLGFPAVSSASEGAPATVAAAETDGWRLVDRIAARVEQDIITQGDVIRAIPSYVQVVGVDPALLRTRDGREEVAREVLDHLIVASLLTAEADDRGVAVSSQEVQRYVDEQRQRLGLAPDDFERALASEGIAPDDFRDFIHGYLTRYRLVQFDVYARIQISDEQIDQALRERFPDGLREILLTTSHVLVQVPRGASAEQVDAAEARARELRAEIDAGRPFEAVAADVNPDASARTGGRIGRTRLGDLDPDYERAALAADVGDIVGPVRSSFGFHLIRLDAREEQAVDNAAQLRERVHMSLHQREAVQQEALYLEQLRNNAWVEIVSDTFEF
ncbi:MAG: hypothetical protein EA398_13380 [Deltaproteobacteria bacterium]|nr:MAG: hypothetical protein EA398_13380 [Deltaproteobacteria bacterium]